ncbi:hypothetical protein KBD45_03770 [Candidatus Dojkabacteria bacterium]|nr:hypothetical protein [Candidatus Dojkabacteria bacterium]
MKNKTKLNLVKSVHTLIWFVMASATLYIFYAGITKTFNSWLWISIFLLTGESIVLIFNKWKCPFTPMAMKYTTDRGDNFGIFLPKRIAKYNKLIFGTIFILGLLLVVFNLIFSR